jgi:hypothetical protein
MEFRERFDRSMPHGVRDAVASAAPVIGCIRARDYLQTRIARRRCLRQSGCSRLTPP